MATVLRPAATCLPALAFLAGLATLPVLAIAAEAPAGPPRTQVVALRVDLDAAGHVVSSTPVDAKSPLNAVAQAYAPKLAFSPARKSGQAVASSTCMSLGLALEPRPDGSFNPHLKRATNGPCVAEVGKARPPKVPRTQGGLVVLGAKLKADGHVDPESITVETAELREPSRVDQSRYIDAATKSLRASRFELETVAGQPVPAHVSAPFRFGSGSDKPERGAPPPPPPMPSWNAVSSVPTIELPKIDFTQP